MPTVYNKVVIDGVTKIDLSQDTVTEAGHILTGHTGHLANGNQVPGTGTGGSNAYTRTQILPVQTFTPDSSNKRATLTGLSEGFVDAGYYIVTYDNAEWIVTCETLWTNNYAIGEAQYFLNTSTFESANPFGIIWMSGTNCTIAVGDTNQHTVKIEKLTFDDDPTLLAQKSITANGTYNASSDNANGYSSVTVNVPSSSPNLQAKTNVSPSTSSQTITADSGYDGLSSVQINAMPSGTAGTPTATKGTVSNHSVTVTPSVTNSAGYIASETKTGIGVTVAASELDNGTKSITSNGTSIDVVGYAAVDVAVPTGVDIPIFTVTWDSGWETIQLTTCNKTYSECCALFDNDGIGIAKVIETNGLESYVLAANVSLRDYQESFIQYTVSTFGGNTVDIKYDDLNETLVATYPSVYNLTLNVTENGTYIPESDEGVYTEVNVSVPTGTTRSASDVTVSGNTVTIPAGLYSSQIIKSVSAGSAGTPTASKGAVSNHSITVTPSVTNTTGYITGGTKTGTGITVSASELVSGSQTISANGTVDVTNLASVNVALTFSTITTSSSSPTGGSNGDIWIKTS